MGKIMKRAGAAVPSSNRITLLRDTDGDGNADETGALLVADDVGNVIWRVSNSE